MNSQALIQTCIEFHIETSTRLYKVHNRFDYSMPAEKIVTWKYGKFHFMSQNISKQLGLLARIRINCLEIQNEHCRNAKICINLQIRSLQHTHQSHEPSARHIWANTKIKWKHLMLKWNLQRAEQIEVSETFRVIQISLHLSTWFSIFVFFDVTTFFESIIRSTNIFWCFQKYWRFWSPPHTKPIKIQLNRCYCILHHQKCTPQKLSIENDIKLKRCTTCSIPGVI